MKQFRRMAAALCAVFLLCGFVIPAYAYADGGEGADYGDPTMTEETTTPEPEPTVDVVQSTWNAISQLDIPSLSDVDAETLSALYGINTDDLVSYVCKMPAISVQATEFFIAEVKEGKMDAVKAAVEKRQADLVQQWSQYLPEQLELVENYQLVTSGNYILFAISEYADQAVSAFNSYTN